MPKGELPPSSPDEILTVVIMKVAIMLKMRLRCDDGNDNGDVDDWH